jgi:beta-glucosidase
MIYELKGIKLNFLLSFLGRVFILFGLCITIVKAGNNKNSIYHNSWIDFNKNGRKDPYENQELSNEKRIEDLLKRMTLEEKTCQMATLYGYGNVLDDELPTSEWKQRIWKDGIANIDEHLNNEEPTQHAWPPSRHAKAINKVQRFFVEETRLGIPVDFTNEGIQGLRHSKTTTFPSQPGVGSTWDLELVNEIGHIVGKEAKALGYTNVYAPIMDIARDPRWGRTTECYTEDPYLASQMGIQMVRALQSEGVVSTPKHFAVYSIPEGGRDGDARANPGAPWREVLTIHLPPFKATIKEAGAMGIMNSYNDYDGIPLAANKKFITEILRNEWGFKGYVISDSWSVEELYGRDSPEGRIRGRKHHVAPTYRDAVRQAVEAGINVRCAFNEPEVYIEPLRELVKDGVIPMELINKRVEDVLRVKFWLGLFNNPYISNPEHSNKIVHTRETRKVSLKAARKSIILLKNEENLLPIDKDVNSILVAGPNAKATSQLLSDYGPKDLEVISVFEGIKEKVSSNTKVKYIKGCKVTDKRFPESDILYEPPSGTVKEKIKKAAELAKKVDIAVVVLGENSNGDHETVSESYSRLNLNLPGYQRDLIKAIYSSGTPTVAVLLNGRPLTINWIDKNVPAILEAWFPGEYTGQAIADVIFGDYNPGGKLPMTFPKFVGQVPMTFPHKISSQNDDSDSRVGGVLYPFGHGLSYTEFEYKDLSITPIVQEQGANIEISFNVKNIGNLKGDEVVQLYLRDIFSSVTPYEKVLRGFKRVTLRPAEKKNIKFTIEPEDMKIVDRNMNWVVEPGEYRIMIGSSSEDIRLMDKFEIVN